MKKIFAVATFSILVLGFGACALRETPPEETAVKESTPLQDKAGVKLAFFQKYKTPVQKIILDITRQNPEYMYGSVSFASDPAPEIKNFFARKKGSAWEIVFEGTEAAPCELLKENAFPEEMMKDCA